MSLQKILGTHQFAVWWVCNRCGRKWDRRQCHCAEIRFHLAECQPELTAKGRPGGQGDRENVNGETQLGVLPC